MATISKTAGTSILSHQAVTHPDTVKGGVQDVSTKLAATLFLFWAPVEATDNTNPGSFLVLVSAAASGDEDWAVVAQFITNGGTADTEALTATEPIGETVLAVALTAGFATLDRVYVQHATLANGEWGILQELATNVSLTLIEGLTNEQTASSVIWNDCNVFVCQLDLTAISRLKVVFSHEGATGANGHVKGIMVTGDSIG